MPTAEKRAILDEISETLQNSGALYVTKYQGMSVDQANKYVVRFAKKCSRKVYKNKLMKLAMQELEGMTKCYPYLQTNAFAFVEDELSAPAKVLKILSRIIMISRVQSSTH